MSDRIIYISRACPHCKKLLIGLHRYDNKESIPNYRRPNTTIS